MSTIAISNDMLELLKAEACINKMVELDSYTLIFEAEDEEVKKQIEINDKASEGAVSHLKKFLESCIAAVKNMIESVKDFIAKRQLDEKERQAYEAFKAACKKDPSLKNKKVTVKDYRAFTEEYKKIVKEAAELDRKLAKDKDADEDVVNKFLESAKSRLAAVSKGAATTVAADFAIEYASSCKDAAKLMHNMLESDFLGFYSAMEKNVGDKGAAKTKKDLKSLSKRISLKRGLMNITGRSADSLVDAAGKTLDNFAKDFGIKNTEGKLDTVATFAHATKNINNTFGSEEGKEVGQSVRNLGKDVAMSAVNYAKDEAIQNVKDTAYSNKAIKNIRSKTDKVHNQSILDSITGANRKPKNKK